MYGNPFVWLIDTLITIYIWLLVAQAVLSWLLAFGVVNRYNRAVGQMRHPVEAVGPGARRQTDRDAHPAGRRRDREVRGGSRG